MENIKIKSLPYAVKFILTRLLDNNFEGYVVGGAVRDAILGRSISDYDITTNASPQQVINLFSDYEVIETGIKHGTVTLMLDSESFEITTYRVDAATSSDNRHPDFVTFASSLSDDLSRRDFTINAMACDIDGNIIDLFHGLDDIKNKVIKCVGDPDIRFNEDGLRILRALRFAAKLGFDIETNTSMSIFKNKQLITNISAERIQKEFNGILSITNIDDAARIIDLYYEVIGVFIPEFLGMRMKQNNRYHIHNDLIEHTLGVVCNTATNLELRLAAFFHDFGKPDTYTEEHFDNGTIQGHFYGHPDISYQKCIDVMRRLKYSNTEISNVSWLVKYHDNTISSTVKSVKRILNKVPSENVFNKLVQLKRADRADHVNLNEKYPEDLDEVMLIKDHIISTQSAFSLKALAVNGYDMIELGYNGPEIGKTLNILLDAVIDEQVSNQKDALIGYAKTLKK